jgi:3-oxoacyl-[acyl-carrier protein] reductase
VSDAGQVDRIGPAAVFALGRVDVWVNNAGADILTGDQAALPPRERLDLLLDVDLRGTILASWRAAELLALNKDGGVIVNMSWDHVLTGMPGVNPQMFAAVKGGVLAFSKSLARTVAPLVRVNVVAPGWISTAFGEGLDDEARRKVEASTPLQRWGTPDDVAGAVVYLASPGAAFSDGADDPRRRRRGDVTKSAIPGVFRAPTLFSEVRLWLRRLRVCPPSVH